MVVLFSDYHLQVLIDAGRCLAVASLATATGWWIGARLPSRWGWWGWLLLVVPLFTPALLISYAYAPIGLWLSVEPWALLVFYSALIIARLVPLAAFVRRLFPLVVSPEARFCARLGPRRSIFARIGFRLRCSGAMPWATLSIAFLLAYADFELASLLSIKTWSVMLFDAHAGGLEIGESLQRMSGPLLIECLALVPLFFVGKHGPAIPPARESCSRANRVAIGLSIVVALVLAGWPVLRLISQAISGFSSLGIREVLGEDILMSLATASVSVGLLWLLLSFTQRRGTRALIALPGLLGGLVLSLVVLGILHLPSPVDSPDFTQTWVKVWASVADTPFPLLITEILLFAPIAVVLRAMLDARRPGESLHLARMAGSRRLLWDLAMQPAAAAVALLFILAYFEFTAGTILAPVSMTPVFARLHNLAHYGQTAVMSAMMLAAIVAPAALLALTLGGARLYARRNVR